VVLDVAVPELVFKVNHAALLDTVKEVAVVDVMPSCWLMEVPFTVELILSEFCVKVRPDTTALLATVSTTGTVNVAFADDVLVNVTVPTYTPLVRLEARKIMLNCALGVVPDAGITSSQEVEVLAWTDMTEELLE
jgi:hypothetical protein